MPKSYMRVLTDCSLNLNIDAGRLAMLACVGFLAAHAATGKVCSAGSEEVCSPAYSLRRARQRVAQHAHVSYHRIFFGRKSVFAWIASSRMVWLERA